jgi:hypothetical protein
MAVVLITERARRRGIGPTIDVINCALAKGIAQRRGWGDNNICLSTTSLLARHLQWSFGPTQRKPSSAWVRLVASGGWGGASSERA